jgi:hypothetical protein
VHAGAREQGNEDGVYERRVVAADEEPVFPAQNEGAELSLGVIVGWINTSLVDEIPESLAVLEDVGAGA